MDLIQNAINKGFHPENEKYYLWEIQKWLREKYNIHIIINPTITDYWTFALCNIGNENIELNGEVIYDSIDYNFYEEALEKGLQEALKLIEL